MLGRTTAVALVGLTGHLVEVEAHLADGLPAFSLVGLPDASLSEARERVRAAVSSSGLTWPSRRATINLSPASLPKSGSGFDLAVAIACLAAAGLPEAEAAARTVHVGELGLDGRVHPVRGILPAVMAAVAAGQHTVVVPEGNAAEARLVPGAEVRGVSHLADLVEAYGGQTRRIEVPGIEVPGLEASGPATAPERSSHQVVGDLADVVGQDEARFAVEVAAAGGHHLALLGPPGAGKTMLGARLAGVLPDLDDEAAIEVTAVHSLAGTFDAAAGLIRRPPLEDPHHTASAAAVIGGGSGMPRPGAATRAHRGILLLDEAPEFSSRVLEALRQPLESGELVLQRAGGTARYPARFQLVVTANPCPCGRASGAGAGCECTPLARRRYRARLSGPLMDRIDVQMEVAPPGRAALALAGPPESSAQVAARVAAARAAQAERWRATPWELNGQVPGSWLREHLALDRRLMHPLERSLDSGLLSLRGVDRVLRLAWTLTDLAGRTAPGADEVATALVLRTPGAGGVG